MGKQTLRQKAHKIGFKSPAALHMIMHGKRVPNTHSLKLILDALKIDEREKTHIWNLVCLERQSRRKSMSLSTLKGLQSHKTSPFAQLSVNVQRHISRWYFSALREMIHLRDFEESSSWIKRRLAFSVTEADIANAINTLVKLGLVERQADGRLRENIKLVTTSDDISSADIRKLHKQHLKCATRALDRFGVQDRYFSGVTFTANSSQLPFIKKALRSAERSILRKFEADQGDVTLRFNFQLYPLTQSLSPEETNYV